MQSKISWAKLLVVYNPFHYTFYNYYESGRFRVFENQPPLSLLRFLANHKINESVRVIPGYNGKIYAREYTYRIKK